MTDDDTPLSVNLRPEDVDRLGQALVTLARELWVLKDRQRVLEAALAEAGVVPAGAVDSWQPDTGLSEELATERRRLIDGLIEVLAAPRD